jgi:hypothetical protein
MGGREAYEGVNWVQVAQGIIEPQAVVNTVLYFSASIKRGMRLS